MHILNIPILNVNTARSHSLLIVYPNQFGYHTDSYKYCEQLKENFNITYYCFDQSFERIDLPGINVVYMAFNTGKIMRLIHFFSHIINYTRNTKVDIIFTIQFKFCFLIGLFTKARIKILDYRTGDLSPNLIKQKLKNIFLWFDSLFFPNISVISEGLRDMLHLNKANTLILPLGGDVISTHTHSYDQMDLLYVGSFNLRNIHQTVEGVAQFIKRNKEYSSLISYTIVGFGCKIDENKIRQTIELNGLTEIVRLVRRKRYTDLSCYFDSCNIGISYVPKTPYYEYQPVTKTFEYVNSGLFTIATNTYENRKVINQINGVLCEDTPESFAGALEQVYRMRESLNETEIRSSLKSYQWDAIVRDVLKPYLQNLLKKS
jgi:hypothetical protein